MVENMFQQKISSNLFWSKMFYGCKIIFSKTGSFQNFHQIFFWSNIFYGCKIISSRTGSCQHFHQNFFGRKCFMVAISFSRKQVPNKIFIKFFFVDHFLWLQNHFLENRFLPKFSSIFFCSKIFLWLQNHFLENKFLPKFSSNFFWSIMFYGCKFISSKTGSYQNFHQIFFGRKCFMVAISFSRKQVPNKIFIKFFLVDHFLWLQNHFLENRFLPKFSSIFFARKFFMVAKSFPRKQVPTKIFIKFFVVENFLWLQTHFLENRFLPKFSSNSFWSKIFYGCKIISS